MAVIEQQLPTGTWTADPIHSTANFAVKHSVIATFRGGFTHIEATLSDADGSPVLTGVVPVAGIEVKDENLQGHLLSPDFFDAELNPAITFTSTSVAPVGNATVLVEGDLTVKGTTRRVEAKGAIAGPAVGVDGNERIGVDLSTTIDRTEFGLNWNAPLPSGALVLGNDVVLTVHLELVRE